MRFTLPLLALSIVVVGSASGAPPTVKPVRVASDPLPAGASGQHATIVEPHSESFGATIVATFQVGRRTGGGAATNGFATSNDRGATWESGLLPGLTPASEPPGPGTFASDPVVAFDAVRGRWLIASLIGRPGGGSVFVSSSADGRTWGLPVEAHSVPPRSLDKDWLTCDNGGRSRFRGRCYLAYADWAGGGFTGQVSVAVRSSSDGGSTWTQPVHIPVEYDVNLDTLSPQPVVRPNGELVIVFFERAAVRAVRSTDGGMSYAPRETISTLTQQPYAFTADRFRGTPTPTVTVDGSGTLYAAWYDCRFRPGCTGNDIVLATSTAPGAWTPVRRIPLTTAGATVDLILPGLAADSASRGKSTRLLLAYYSLSSHDCSGGDCRLRAGLATSTSAGASWQVLAVDAEPMRLDWLASTAIGRMVGDYVGVSFVRRRAVAVMALANAPSGGQLDEALYALRPPFSPLLGAGTPRIGSIARRSAVVTALIDPQGSRTRYSFELRRRGKRWRAASTAVLAADATPRTVRVKLRRLEPATRYAVRVSAANAAGRILSSPAGFRTRQVQREPRSISSIR
jgi:hypothetical protein